MLALANPILYGNTIHRCVAGAAGRNVLLLLYAVSIDPLQKVRSYPAFLGFSVSILLC